MATRKDYRLIARALSSIKPVDSWEPDYSERLQQWEQTTRTIAHAFTMQRTKFDQTRFFQLATLTETQRQEIDAYRERHDWHSNDPDSYPSRYMKARLH